MNRQKASKKNIIIIIGIVLLALVVYFYYEGSRPTADTSFETVTANADAEAVGSRVLSLLNQIRSLKIDTTVFKDPAYMSLRDYSVAIPQEDVGRENPFAPISGLSAATSSGRTSR
jgi:hypothetical protein